MNIAIIHAGDVGFVARLMNIFPSEEYDIEVFEPTQSNFGEICQEISHFDPDVVILYHEFDGFTGYRLVSKDSLSYRPGVCIGISSDSSQEDYCHFKIDPESNLEDLNVRQGILDAINCAATA